MRNDSEGDDDRERGWYTQQGGVGFGGAMPPEPQVCFFSFFFILFHLFLLTTTPTDPGRQGEVSTTTDYPPQALNTDRGPLGTVAQRQQGPSDASKAQATQGEASTTRTAPYDPGEALMTRATPQRRGETSPVTRGGRNDRNSHRRPRRGRGNTNDAPSTRGGHATENGGGQRPAITSNIMYQLMLGS